MSIVKKIINKIGEGAVEMVKDSAKQIVDTIGPEALIKSAMPKSTGNEMSDYLKGLSPDMTNEELVKKQKEVSSDDEAKKAEIRQALQAAIPDHMKLPAKAEPSIYEQKIHEEEQKKAMMVEAQKKQQAQSGLQVTSKQSRGMLGKKKNKAPTPFEAQKNIKVG